MELRAYATALAAVVVLWLISAVFTRSWNPLALVEGADKRPSTSKFQWWLWTVVVAFAYTLVYAARAWRGNFAVIDDIPPNLLIVMGLSAATMTAAKGITVGYIN